MIEHLFIDFANSLLYDGHGNIEDRLLVDSWHRDLLRKWHIAPSLPINDTELKALAELRSTIRAITERVRVGRLPSRSDLDCLNATLDHSRNGVHRMSTQGGLSSQPEYECCLSHHLRQ